MKTVNVVQIKLVAFQLARESMSFNEPIPDFETRYPNILESCVAVPFQTFQKKPLYKGLLGKAAILFYLLNKNHPFQNGNKRIAITTLFYFLYKNKKWLKVDNQELYNFAIWIAQSPSEVKDQAIKSIERFLKSHLINLQQDRKVKN